MDGGKECGGPVGAKRGRQDGARREVLTIGKVKPSFRRRIEPLGMRDQRREQNGIFQEPEGRMVPEERPSDVRNEVSDFFLLLFEPLVIEKRNVLQDILFSLTKLRRKAPSFRSEI